MAKVAQFEKGKTVVFGPEGFARVEGIGEREMLGKRVTVVDLFVLDSKMNVTVPLERPSSGACAPSPRRRPRSAPSSASRPTARSRSRGIATAACSRTASPRASSTAWSRCSPP